MEQHDVRARQILNMDLRLDAQTVANMPGPPAHEGEARDRRQLDGQAAVALVPPVDLGRDDDGDFRVLCELFVAAGGARDGQVDEAVRLRFGQGVDDGGVGVGVDLVALEGAERAVVEERGA